MNRALLALSLLILLSTAASAQSLRERLVGTWANDDQTVSYEFQASGEVWFEQQGQGVPISEYTLTEGELHAITFHMQMGPQTLKVPALLKVVSHDEIWIEQFSPGAALPTSFSEEPRRIHILHRQP